MYFTINGWTKAKMKEVISSQMMDHASVTTDKHVQCRYRADDGNKCAVGVFISDKQYYPDMENESLRLIFDHLPELKDTLPLNIEGLIKMQQAHDDTIFEADYQDRKSTAAIDPRPRILAWIEENVSDPETK